MRVTNELAEWATSAHETDPEWADFNAATFRPLGDQRPDLAANLADRFVRRFLRDAGLSANRYDEAREMLCIEEGTTPLGHSLLQVSFRFTGSITTMEWDGTDEDAGDVVVHTLAQTLAEDVDADRAMFGPTGWESEADDP